MSGLVVGDRRTRADGATLDVLFDRRLQASGIGGENAWRQRVLDLDTVGERVFALAGSLTPGAISGE
ncbi:MAG: hypothetical protein ABI949_06360 [Ilumatobacteraceae bacterium]